MQEAPEHRRIGSRAVRRRGGFTLIEILIVVVILGILATIVIPQFSSASQQARESTLRDELQFLRTQLVVFKAQHRDVAAGYPGGIAAAVPTEADFVRHMTLFSDDLCNTGASASGTYRWGVYLSRMPINPKNNLATVMVIPNGQAMPAPDNSTGWIYKPQTVEIIANMPGNDSNGLPYSKY